MYFDILLRRSEICFFITSTKPPNLQYFYGDLMSFITGHLMSFITVKVISFI